MSFDVKLYAKLIYRKQMKKMQQSSERMKQNIEDANKQKDFTSSVELLNKSKIHAQKINITNFHENEGAEDITILESNYAFIIFSYLIENNPALGGITKKLRNELRDKQSATSISIEKFLKDSGLGLFEQYMLLKIIYLNDSFLSQSSDVTHANYEIIRSKIEQLSREDHSEIILHMEDAVDNIKTQIGLSKSLYKNLAKNYQSAYGISIDNIGLKQNNINYEDLLSLAIINFGGILELTANLMRNNLSFEIKEKLSVYASAIYNARKIIALISNCNTWLPLIKINNSSRSILEALDGFNIDRIANPGWGTGGGVDTDNYALVEWANRCIFIVSALPESFFLKPQDKNNCINKFKLFIEANTNKKQFLITYL